jgi:hypothetical protein
VHAEGRADAQGRPVQNERLLKRKILAQPGAGRLPLETLRTDDGFPPPTAAPSTDTVDVTGELAAFLGDYPVSPSPVQP